MLQVVRQIADFSVKIKLHEAVRARILYAIVVEGVQMYSAHTNNVKNPRTPKQIAHRARFAEAIAVGKGLSGAINVGLKNTAAGRKLQSVFNVFVHKNLPQITYDAETGLTTTDYAHVVLSEGDTPYVTFGTPSFSTALTVNATFEANSDIPGTNDDDSVYLVVYSPVLGSSMMAIAARSAGTVSVTLPSVWAGETMQVWGFVMTSVEDVTRVENYGITLRPGGCSDSSYVDTGTVSGE